MDEQKRFHTKKQIYYEHFKSAINAKITKIKRVKLNVFKWYKNITFRNIWKVANKQGKASKINARDSKYFIQSIT